MLHVLQEVDNQTIVIRSTQHYLSFSLFSVLQAPCKAPAACLFIIVYVKLNRVNCLHL